MCCRYFIDDKADELLPYFEIAGNSPLTEKMRAKLGKPLVTRGEIRPTDMAAVIALNRRGLRTAFPMIWGYTAEGARGPLFNARSETAGEKPVFRDGWERRRCIVPASCFFEWGPKADPSDGDAAGKQKVRYAVQPAGKTVTWLAGIYRMEEKDGFQYPAFTILTRKAEGPMSGIHERMPLILPKSAITDWLSPGSDPTELLRQAVLDLVLEESAG